VVFSLLTVFLLLLALACVTGSVMLHHAAAVAGLACSLPGLFCGLRQGWREFMRLLVPRAQDRTQAQRVR
jgi:succinate-acetate transporter protein